MSDEKGGGNGMPKNGTERTIGKLQGQMEGIDKRQDRMDSKLAHIQNNQTEMLTILKEGGGKIASLKEKCKEMDYVYIGLGKEVQKNTNFRYKSLGIVSTIGAVAGFIVVGAFKIIEFFNRK